jgi:hypothetical protein
MSAWVTQGRLITPLRVKVHIMEVKQKKRCKDCCNLKPTHEFSMNSKYKDNKDIYCRDCKNARRKRNRDRKLAAYKENERARARRFSASIRKETLAAYGNCCACCGEDTPEFLTLDHIKNDGADHRRLLGGRSHCPSTQMYRWLKAAGFPRDNFQLLCYNCNCAKGKYGACPHSKTSVNLSEAA